MKTKWIFCWLWLVATVVCSGMDSEASKSMKVPTFSGQAKDYEAWWMRFTAYAALVGFSGALTTTRMANLPNTEEEEQLHCLPLHQGALRSRCAWDHSHPNPGQLGRHVHQVPAWVPESCNSVNALTLLF